MSTSTSTPAPGPLASLRVLECSSFLAGPLAAMVLGDWGADVVKLEPPQGELARHIGPGSDTGITPVFAAANRGKRAVSADLRGEQGRRVAAELAAGADVIVHNMQERVAVRLGLCGEPLREANPGAIVCAISAFGPDGPYAQRTGLDSLIQAMSGMASITGPPEGEPMRAGPQVIDVGAGLMAAASILAALVGRGASGAGSEVSVSLFDLGLLFNSTFFPLRSLTGTPIPRLGNRSHPIVADQFAGADGWIVLAFWDDARWADLCRVLGREQWLDREQWSSNQKRLDDYAELHPALAEAIASHPVEALRAQFAEVGIPAAVTLDLDQVLADPHVLATDALYRERRVPGPELDLVVGPTRFDGRRPPVSAARRPPQVGEHTREVLAEWLGADADRTDALFAAGAIS